MEAQGHSKPPGSQHARFDVDRIKREVDIVDLVVSRYGAVVRGQSGRNVTCHCFAGTHEDRNPSMTLYTEDNHAHCFSCNAHFSDVIDLVMKMDGVSFVQACELLEREYLGGAARSADLGARWDTQQRARAVPEHVAVSRQIKDVMNAASRHYAAQLVHHQDVQGYLMNLRGLSADTISRLGIGYAPGNTLGRGIYKTLAGNMGLLMDCGLMYEPTEGRERVESMEQRITFPVMDAAGDAVYLIGRAMKPNQQPKYLGLSDGAVHKVPMIAGHGRKAAIVVEGPLDFAALVQWGKDRDFLCMATLGTAQSRAVAKLKECGVTSVVHMTDQDHAGIAAGLKLAQTLAADGIAVRVVVDMDRQAQLEAGLSDLDVPARRELLAQAPDTLSRDMLSTWRALREIEDVRALREMNWLCEVSWKSVAKDAGDLLVLKDRGRVMFNQAL